MKLRMTLDLSEIQMIKRLSVDAKRHKEIISHKNSLTDGDLNEIEWFLGQVQKCMEGLMGGL